MANLKKEATICTLNFHLWRRFEKEKDIFGRDVDVGRPRRALSGLAAVCNRGPRAFSAATAAPQKNAHCGNSDMFTF